jgi:hypothetical protein
MTTCRRDEQWQPALAGFLSAAGLVFEDDKRSAELMLYCMPKGMNVVFGMLERNGWARRFRGGATLLFCAAMGLVLAADRHDLKGAYAGLLKALFGDDSTTVLTLFATGAHQSRGASSSSGESKRHAGGLGLQDAPGAADAGPTMEAAPHGEAVQAPPTPARATA